MSTVSDILALLEKWPSWKAIKEVPGRLDALEKRLAALEAKPLQAPGKACPSCGQMTFRVTASRPSTTHFGQLGAMDRDYACGACGFKETRQVDKTK